MYRRLLFTAFLAAATGCEKPAPKLAETKPTEVLFDRPTARRVLAYEDFTGRTEPVNAVEIRAQVTGYLKKIHFKDGADVKAGDALFDIDPRTYEANAEQARASVVQAEARRDRVQRDYDRIAKLAASTAVSQEEFDKVKGDKQEADAAVAAAKATLKLAEQNLDYTHITAPFDGRLSKRAIDEGNVVKANDTLLTSVVSLDPIYATFDMDERTLLKVRRLIARGEADSARLTDVKVLVGLSDEDGFTKAREGVVSFIDNKVESATGTLRIRATLQNRDGLLSPGLFVRVRVFVGREHDALLLPEEAIGSDQGLKYVYVLNDRDEVVYRRVVLGQQDGKLRVVESGVKADDRIVVVGLQRVKQGAKVSPKQWAPPTLPAPPGVKT